MKTVIGVFDDYSAAERVVLLLLKQGLAPAEDISVLARDTVRRTHQRTPDLAHDLEEHPGSDPVVTGAGTGSVVVGGVGGVLGVLAGLGAIALPGIGSAIAAGPVLAALAGTTVGAVTGAVGGALVGELARLGVPRLDAHFYAEAIRRDGTLVVVRAPNEAADRVAHVLSLHGALDVDEHRVRFETTDFTEYSPDASPHTGDEIIRELREDEHQRASVGPPPSAGRAQIFGA